MSDKMVIEKRKGVFLVIVDMTEEFLVAVDYASQFANAEDGYVALLNVIEYSYVQNWKNVEDRVRSEMRGQAEQATWDAAGRVMENTHRIPMICIEEGDRVDLIIKTIEENNNIVALVLASANSSKPGPLITYFSGKGLSRLPIPLMIIPGHLEPLSIS
ncbi:MAG: universal stress family protein [Alphaproteobacteria bacterium]|nr:MAG: universal stress family protein [Alphaproteobacteria bacterium]